MANLLYNWNFTSDSYNSNVLNSTIDDSKNGDDILTLNKNIEILDFDKNSDYDKMTVPELKKLVKDKNPEISITKLKKDELVSILLTN